MKIKTLIALSTLALLAACGDKTTTTPAETSSAPQVMSSSEPDASAVSEPAVQGASEPVSKPVNEDGRGPNSQARKDAFNAMLEEFGLMGKMVKGETPYDAEAFKTAAATFAQKGLVPFEHFAQDGAGLNGEAKDNVWTDAAAFEAEVTKYKTAVQNLSEVAANNTDINKIKPAFGAAAATCKSCHDTFRQEK
ncbi:c-type cytochrome [Neisseria sp. Ec49-e6-T10]|uniref:c-type cytochrome n=1 Tax=Neisseria sp. Ec49-e6-T10 TaxID=3140744 RepID=UPI003EC1349D